MDVRKAVDNDVKRVSWLLALLKRMLVPVSDVSVEINVRQAVDLDFKREPVPTRYR
jgi:hypothetical protein